MTAAVVGKIDDAMLYYEFAALKGVEISDCPPYIAMAHDFAPHSIEDTERRFLDLFSQLYD